MAHPGWRFVKKLERVAGRVARTQAPRRLYRMASNSGKYHNQRWLRSTVNRMGCEPKRDGQRH